MHATKLILLAGDDSRKAELQLIEEINRADRIRMVHIVRIPSRRIHQLHFISIIFLCFLFLKMAAKTGGNRNTLHVAADSGCVKNLRTIISALSAHDLLSDYIDCPCDVISVY